MRINRSPSDPNGALEYLNTVSSSESGDYQAAYAMVNETSDEYAVEVGTSGLTAPEKTYFIYNPDSVDLTDLSLSAASISPVFKPDITHYTAHVEYGTSISSKAAARQKASA